LISRDTYIELTKFAIVGAICFGLDLSLYYGLTVMLGLPTFVAKALSVISATMFNYYLNKTWTWGQSNHDPRRFAKYVLLYSISGLLNVLSNEAFLKWLPDNEFQMLIIHAEQAVQQPFFTIKIDKILAVLGATMVGLLVNFIGQKTWVFKDLKNPTFPEDQGNVH
jgi:putative flippase GtrA